ncbi:glycine betaine/L-proline ABC transporter ATP-binding protein [Alkalicella caledoniensis]|uniref:Quaternary amine transport ATP-binding protein n=1 Tax=Alkalicella caledoniensis TaxID=2731377 RepID=A0A7G9W8G1_ALKCA|nr:glycine betaine/L-proline ABC transporter ATP-binding protein [Alkalicella caledoniensis]QNO14973.1 glycine betaine/L-proline ABC transporter ATP-binding protein [Alkalicella caledoniensis]
MGKKISVRNLYKVFGKKPKRGLKLIEEGMSKDSILKNTGLTVGINNVSFDVNEGEIFVIMGLSGSGKSTLVRCLNRLVEPTKGEILIDGTDILKMENKNLREVRRKSVSMVFQNFALLPNRTIIKNVEYGLEVQGIDKEIRSTKAREALSLVGLEGYENSLPDQLSGGMKQRVGLARALANDPEILLMDEAFSALDPLIRGDMQDELLELQHKMKKTIIFITHDLDEALKIGDRIMLMKDGEAVQIGTADEILSKPANDYVRRFVDGVNKNELLTAADIMVKPFTTVDISQGPRTCLKEMKKYGLEVLLVTDKSKRLEGIVEIDDIYKLIESGESKIESIVKDHISRVSLNASLNEVLESTFSNSIPTAVVNEKGKLMGVIVKGSILEALLPERSDDIA